MIIGSSGYGQSFQVNFYAETVRSSVAGGALTVAFNDKALQNAMKHLWNDSGVRKALERGNEYQLGDSAK